MQNFNIWCNQFKTKMAWAHVPFNALRTYKFLPVHFNFNLFYMLWMIVQSIQNTCRKVKSSMHSIWHHVRFSAAPHDP